MGSSARTKNAADEETAAAAARAANDPSMGNPIASSGILQRSQERQASEAAAAGSTTTPGSGNLDTGVYAQVTPGGRADDAPAAPEDSVADGSAKGILGSAAARRRSRFQAGNPVSISI